MNIIFNPPLNTENQYIQIMIRPLQEEGYQVHELDTFFSSWEHFRSIQLVHLNWFENVDDTSLFKALKSFLRKMVVLTAIHVSGKKLVWTMHNRVTHEKKTGHFSRFLTRRLIKWSDAIIIHCEQSKKLLTAQYPSVGKKIHHIPHPDFVDSYGPVARQASGDNHKLHLLFIGAVKPYKNIELLIESIGPLADQVSLTIAGKPKDEPYKQTLTELAAAYPNIDLVLQFIPDHLLPELLGKADLLVLPYDLQSSLNSGTVILAFSYQKTVICPEIGTLVDMFEAKNSFFSYHYRTACEHKEKIISAVQQALKLTRTNPGALDEMGKKMQDFVLDHNDKTLVGTKLKELYHQLLTE